jgi:hypothetical protein
MPDTGPLAASAKRQLSATAYGAIIVVLVMVLYHAFWWNRYMALHAGDGYFALGLWYLDGLMPYRDYFGCTCPLSIFVDAGVIATFGKFYWTTRALGVFERVSMAAVIYLWLRRLFPPGQSALAAIVTTIAGSGSFTDPLDAFHQRSELYAIAAGCALGYALEAKDKMFLLLSATSGFFVALCLCTKQSVGGLAALITPTVAGLSILNGKPKDLRRLSVFFGCYSVAFVLIVGALLLWLAKLGVLQSFFYQVFVQGPSAKASHPMDFVIRFGLLIQQYLPCFIVALCLMPWVLLKLFSSASGSQSEPLVGSENTGIAKFSTDSSQLWIVSILSVLSVSAGILLAFSTPALDKLTVPMVLVACAFKIVAIFCIASTTLYCFFYLYLWATGTASNRHTQFFVFSAVSFGTMLSSSLSFPLTNEALLPALGLVVAATLGQVGKWKKVVVYGSWALLILGSTYLKCTVPFGFENIFEQAASQSNTVSAQSALKGMILPKEIVEFLDGTVDIINKNARPDDTIFTYPEIEILHVLSNRKFPTFSPMHIMDITSDKFGVEEAARILEKKPAVLVYIRDPEQLRMQEEGWRFGKPSGNRAIVAACETLAKEYALARTFRIGVYKKDVMVFVRPR